MRVRPAAVFTLSAGLALLAACSTAPQSSPSLPQTPLQPAAVAEHSVQAPFQLHFPPALMHPHPPAVRVQPDANSKQQTESINPAGGSVTLPKFHGFSGSVGYTANNAPSGTTITLTSSVQNLGGAPKPPKGKAIFYVQGTLNSSSFLIDFQNGNASATLASRALLKTKTYTIYVYAEGSEIGSFNAGHPKHGKLTFASPISNVTIPTGITVILQVAQN